MSEKADYEVNKLKLCLLLQHRYIQAQLIQMLQLKSCQICEEASLTRGATERKPLPTFVITFCPMLIACMAVCIAIHSCSLHSVVL